LIVNTLRQEIEQPATFAPAAAAVENESAAVTHIRRAPRWQAFNLAELWRYRELLYFLTWRDVKVRYKQAVLGAAWAVLQPLAIMVVFSLFFARLVYGSDIGVPYPLYVLCGLLPWTFFGNAITAASQSVVGSQHLVTKVYFPRLIIPMGAVGAGLVDFAIGLVVLLGFQLLKGFPPSAWTLLLPLVVLGLVITALGVGTLLAALTVAYRDFRYVIPFMVQLWMFCTPSIYLRAADQLAPKWAPFLPLNPAYGLILNFRALALGQPPELYSLSVSLGVGVLLLLVGCWYFRHTERNFADII
jgi:lipopolysaccharide transport system permease protein